MDLKPEALDVEGISHLRTVPLRRTQFIADGNLGDIVSRMRLLGFDVYCDASVLPRDLVRISNTENRIILSRSRSLLKFREITHGIYIYPTAADEQVRRIMDLLDIRGAAKPFSRCIRCNTLLKKVAKEHMADRIPPRAKASCDSYMFCESCQNIYWKGTHYLRMKEVVERLLGSNESK